MDNYEKIIYYPVGWKNKSESLKTPIDKNNLNKMDNAIKKLCENMDVIYNGFNIEKLDKSSANKLLSETPTWDAETGILTFKFFDGTEFSIDFNVEKIPVSFSLHSNGVLVMTTEDGTEWQADIGSMIPTYNFNNSQRIRFGKIKNADGSVDVNADILKGSITDEYLEPNYLANITAQAQSASSSAENASTSENNALTDAKLSQSYAVGKSGIREGEDTDNAKYYSEQAKKIANLTIDDELSSTSENPVQNKVLYEKIQNIINDFENSKVTDSIVNDWGYAKTIERKESNNGSASVSLPKSKFWIAVFYGSCAYNPSSPTTGIVRGILYGYDGNLCKALDLNFAVNSISGYTLTVSGSGWINSQSGGFTISLLQIN